MMSESEASDLRDRRQQMEERDEERRREVVANDLISLLPKDGSASALQRRNCNPGVD